MRKLYIVIGALILALFITSLVFWIQGKTLMDLFGNDEDQPNLPTLETTETPEVKNEEVNLTYTERMQKADDYFQQGFYTLAATEYAKAALIDPNQLSPYLKLTDTHLRLRNFDKAMANVQTVLSKDPQNAEAKLDEILIKIKLSDFNTARQLVDAYPVGTAQAADVLYYKGLLAAISNDRDLAKTSLNEALQNLVSPELLGQVQSGSCNYKNEAALNGADNAKQISQIARILCSYTEFETTQAGEEFYLKILLAKSLNENEEYEMAIQILKETLKARGEIRDGWILLGFSYLNLGNYQFALTAFDKAYSLDSTWPTTHYFLGVTHKELGDLVKAIFYFDLALKGDFEPKVVIQNHLADLYFQTKAYEKAAEAYEAVLEVNKQDVNAFIRPVWLYLDYLDEPQKALTLAQTTVNTFPEAAMSYNLLGWSYIGMGDYNNADANLKKALELDPNLAAAYHNLGLMNEKWGKNDLALQYYQKAYEIDQNGSIGSLAAQHYNELLKKMVSSDQ